MALSRKECTPYHPYEEESAHLSEFHSVELFYYAPPYLKRKNSDAMQSCREGEVDNLKEYMLRNINDQVTVK